MLVELVIHNLVIVKQARLTPGVGLCVISGETGAGKSLLLDALLVLLGGRASGKLVGPHGAEAMVTGVFQLAPELAERVEHATGVAILDSACIVRRRLFANGRSQAWLNDVPVTVSALQQVADLVLEVRAQHEPQRLGQVARQLELLDGYGGLGALAVRYAQAHHRCLDLTKALADLEHGERDSVRELDYLTFQMREFTALDPRPGELAELERRHELLSGAAAWQARIAEALDLLAEGERPLQRVVAQLARRFAEAPDERLRQVAIACTAATEHLREAETSCRSVADQLHVDPTELQHIEERRNAYYDLMRKHGDSETELFAARAAIEERMAAIQGLDARRAALQQELAAIVAERQRLGEELADGRERAFTRLAQEMVRELADLGMPKARLHLHRSESAAPGPHGICHQEIHVATNPGLPPDRLGTVMSGGEASRLSLAFAIVLAEHDHTPVLVFDEVDSGVGGRLGSAIGDKLRALGRHRSVLVITHTPQVAAAATRHYAVRKTQSEAQTEVVVDEVDGNRRIQEIADMLGGGKAALGQAKALIGASA